MFLQRAGPYGVWGSWAEHRLGGCFDDELAFGQLGRAALRGRDFGDRAQQPVDNELEGGGGGGGRSVRVSQTLLCDFRFEVSTEGCVNCYV